MARRARGAVKRTGREGPRTAAGKKMDPARLATAEAQLLGTALTGAAQVAARWWLASDRPVRQEDAVHLLESLLWRGISNFPRQA